MQSVWYLESGVVASTREEAIAKLINLLTTTPEDAIMLNDEEVEE